MMHWAAWSRDQYPHPCSSLLRRSYRIYHFKAKNGEFSIILSPRSAFSRHRGDAGTQLPGGPTQESIIDTVTKLMSPEAADSVRVKYVPSASDLTGIRIKFTRMVEEIFRVIFRRRTGDLSASDRFYINSLSTLLIYRRVEMRTSSFTLLRQSLKKWRPGSLCVEQGILWMRGPLIDETTDEW